MLVIYFVATAQRPAERVRFPLTEGQRDLLAVVPPHAEVFALIPSAAAVRDRLDENPLTRELLAAWSEQAWLPEAWMLGGADLVLWMADGQTSYAFRVDGLRARLVRAWLAVRSADLHVEGSTFFIGTPPAERIGQGGLAPFLELAAELPPGEAFVVQKTDRQMFPPTERPAVSTVAIGAREVDIVSRARSAGVPSGPPQRISLPRGALLSAWFGEPPRLIRDIDRLVPGQISTMLAGGGSAVLYEIESGLLLPRPKGLFVIPATVETRRGADKLRRVVELLGEVTERNDRILISIDRTSLALYEVEQLSELPFPATEWALRIDAARMAPALERLGDHVGLRLATPRLYRSVVDLRQWIAHLEAAGGIEAALAAGGRGEELRVRITAK